MGKAKGLLTQPILQMGNAGREARELDRVGRVGQIRVQVLAQWLTVGPVTLGKQLLCGLTESITVSGKRGDVALVDL